MSSSIHERPRSETLANVSLIGIEDVLVELIKDLMNPYRLDTEIEDIPISDIEREQTLEGKVKPEVYAGYIPLTVTGEILPGVVKIPSVIVQAQDSAYSWDGGSGTVRLLVATYSQSQNRQGYRDALNLAERIIHEIWCKLVIKGVAAVVASDVNSNPVTMRLLPSDELNIFYALITTIWELVTPTPDMHFSGQTPWILPPQPAHPLP